jgi:hypothetical protein
MNDQEKILTHSISDRELQRRWNAVREKMKDDIFTNPRRRSIPFELFAVGVFVSRGNMK